MQPLREVHYSPFRFAQGMRDTEGRPLGELHAPDDARVGVAFELRACPYDGDRRGHPMNTSALSQARRHHAGALERLAAWRAAVAATGDLVGAPESLATWWTALVVLSEPGWRFRTRAERPDGAAATLHKSLMGVASLAWAAFTVDAGAQQHGVRRPEEWVALAEDVGLFVHAETGHACAGPPARVRVVLEACLVPASPAAAVPAERLSYGRAVAALEVGRAAVTLASEAAALPPRPDVARDWAGDLCVGLDRWLARATLTAMVGTPLTRTPSLTALTSLTRHPERHPLAALQLAVDDTVRP